MFSDLNLESESHVFVTFNQQIIEAKGEEKEIRTFYNNNRNVMSLLEFSLPPQHTVVDKRLRRIMCLIITAVFSMDSVHTTDFVT